METRRSQRLASDFSVGFVLFVATLVVVVLLFLVGRPDDFFGDMDTFKVHVPSAAGLTVGAKVLLKGFDAGTVSAIDLPTEEEMATAREDPGVVLTVSINRKYSHHIRVNSVGWLQTQGLLGDAAVSIGLGTMDQPRLESGLRITYRPRSLLNEFAGEEFSENTATLLQEVLHLLRDLNRGKGTLGQILKNEDLYNGANDFARELISVTKKLHAVSDEASGLLSEMRARRGTLGKLLSDSELYDEATKTVSEAQELLASFKSQGVVGRLLSDEALAADLVSLVRRWKTSSERLDRVLARLDDGEGSVGMLLQDPSIAAGLRHVLLGVRESGALTNLARAAERVGRDVYLRDLELSKDREQELLRARALSAIEPASPQGDAARPGPATRRELEAETERATARETGATEGSEP